MKAMIELITPWEAWIIRTDKSHNVISSDYDKLCELVVFQYGLTNRTREMNFLDKVTFFCHWWFNNKNKMHKYRSSVAIGRLLGGRDHASVFHHINVRTPTANYQENTECIKDFLES